MAYRKQGKPSKAQWKEDGKTGNKKKKGQNMTKPQRCLSVPADDTIAISASQKQPSATTPISTADGKKRTIPYESYIYNKTLASKPVVYEPLNPVTVKRSSILPRLVDICKKTQEELKKQLETELTNLGYVAHNCDGFLFAKGTVPVLLVAHMDTVHFTPVKTILEYEMLNGTHHLTSPQGIGGDDRCGIYMIMEIVKELKCSVLFTEDEECGCIGAKKLEKYNMDSYKKDMNFIIEFDRKGHNDAVYYGCNNKEFEKFINTVGEFRTAIGSCSDISYVAPFLGLAAVNLSCGYYKAHSKSEYIVIEEMLENIERAKKIIVQASEIKTYECGNKFEYVEKSYVSPRWTGRASYNGWEEDYYPSNANKSGLYSNQNTIVASSMKTVKNEEEFEQDIVYKIIHCHNGTAGVSYSFGADVNEAMFIFFKRNRSFSYGDIVSYEEDYDMQVCTDCYKCYKSTPDKTTEGQAGPICDECAKEYDLCGICGDLLHKSDFPLTEVDGARMCEDCYDELFYDSLAQKEEDVECDFCKLTFAIEDTFPVNDVGRLCGDCYDDYMDNAYFRNYIR